MTVEIWIQFWLWVWVGEMVLMVVILERQYREMKRQAREHNARALILHRPSTVVPFQPDDLLLGRIEGRHRYLRAR